MSCRHETDGIHSGLNELKENAVELFFLLMVFEKGWNLKLMSYGGIFMRHLYYGFYYKRNLILSFVWDFISSWKNIYL